LEFNAEVNTDYILGFVLTIYSVFILRNSVNYSVNLFF